MKKLNAHQIWKKKQAEDLTDNQYKQLLINNRIIIKKKVEPNKELITMLTSYVQQNREDYAHEVFELCEGYLSGVIKSLPFYCDKCHSQFSKLDINYCPCCKSYSIKKR